MAQWVRQLDYLTTHTNLSPIRRGFALGFVNYKKGCTLLATASDKVYQLLAHGRWFSPGTPASSTTKTGRHDIAEILLKVALNTINQSFVAHCSSTYSTHSFINMQNILCLWKRNIKDNLTYECLTPLKTIILFPKLTDRLSYKVVSITPRTQLLFTL